MARPRKGSKCATRVTVFLPPACIKAVDEKIPEYGRTRSAIIRLIVLNWAEEGWVLKKER